MENRLWREPFDERLLREAVTLGRTDLLQVRRARGALLFIQHGRAWVTQERDPRDIVLRAGQWLRFYGDGDALVQALPTASITITAPFRGASAIKILRATRRRRYPRTRALLAWWIRLHRYGRRALAARALTHV